MVEAIELSTNEDNQQKLMLASNRVFTEKINNPGSHKYYEALGELVTIISNVAGALDLFKAHQLDK